MNSKSQLPPKSQGMVVQRASEKMINSEPKKTSKVIESESLSTEKDDTFESQAESQPEPSVESKVNTTQQQSINTSAYLEQQQDTLVDYTVKLLTKALDKSKESGFSAISFQFSDLEIIFRVVSIIQQRTKLLNMLTSQVHARDLSLSQSVFNIEERLNQHTNFTDQVMTNVKNLTDSLNISRQDLEKLIQSMKTIKDLSVYFLPPEVKLSNESSKS